MKTIIALLLLCALPLGAFAQKEFVITGKMMHTDLEGGCWYLSVKDTKYELSGSPEDLAKCYVEYRPVTLRVRPGGMMGSTCMLGKRLIIVEVLDTMFHPHNPPVYQRKIVGTVHRTKAGCWYVIDTKKTRYELQSPIPKQYLRIGTKYNRKSRFVPGTESNCGMDGVILFP